jgi:tetratricopeptide (TPR) repeat protein
VPKIWGLYPFCFFLLSAVTLNICVAAESDIIKYYGGLVKNSPQQLRIHSIFNRVQKAAPKKSEFWAKLKIVRGRPNDRFAVVALPNNTVLLSKQVIKFSYRRVSKKHGDARLAFILGHELAHIANKHLLPKAFLGTPSYSEKLQENRGEKGRQQEIEADEQGFVYAAMAGYAVDDLLWERDGDFFITWQKETDANWQPDSTHPSVEKRAKALYEKLKALLSHLPYFHFGVRLAHFGQCDKAVYFFEEFEKHFPAREVYNNLGGCHLQWARENWGKAAYSYWLPSVLDETTILDDLSLVSKGDEMSTQTKEILVDAKKYFEIASKKDPYYAPAKVNFAIAAFYLEEFDDALVAIEKAYQLEPDNLDIQGLRAVIRYEKGEQSIEDLENLAQQANAPLSVIYNTAQILEKSGRAENLRQRLIQRASDLPAPIRHLVCENCPQKQGKVQKTWHLPTNFAHWSKNDEVRLHDLYEEIYQHPDGNVLLLGEKVEMVVLKKPGVTVNDLPAYCEQPLRTRRVVNGTLSSCQDWAALVVDDVVEEVWVVK